MNRVWPIPLSTCIFIFVNLIRWKINPKFHQNYDREDSICVDMQVRIELFIRAPKTNGLQNLRFTICVWFKAKKNILNKFKLTSIVDDDEYIKPCTGLWVSLTDSYVFNFLEWKERVNYLLNIYHNLLSSLISNQTKLQKKLNKNKLMHQFG